MQVLASADVWTLVAAATCGSATGAHSFKAGGPDRLRRTTALESGSGAALLLELVEWN
jgi:hypothetical protein